MLRRLLLGFLLLLVIALVAVDRFAAATAADRVAQRLQSELGAQPDVSIRGFPFLLQALRGRYDDISVATGALQRGGVRVASVKADLRGVDLPLSAALGSVDRVPVDSVDAMVLLTYADLSAAVPGRRLTFSEEGGRLRLRGSVELLGQRLTGSGLGTVRITGDRLTVVPGEVTIDGLPSGVAVPPSVLSALTLSTRVQLPFGLRLESVAPRADGLVAVARGRDVVLQRIAN